MVVHICNPSNWGREPWGSEVHPLIQSDLKVSQLNDQSRSTSSGWTVNLYERWGIQGENALTFSLLSALSPPLRSSLSHLGHYHSLLVSLPDSSLSKSSHWGQTINSSTLCSKQTMGGSLLPHGESVLVDNSMEVWLWTQTTSLISRHLEGIIFLWGLFFVINQLGY